MFYMHWIFIILYVVIVVLALLAVLMDNRQPAKTVAWVMVLTFIPFAGIVIYFFFGQNYRKQRFISQHSLDALTKRSMLEFAEQRNLHFPEKAQQLVHLFANQSMALPFKDNEIEIFTTGADYFLALLKAIGQAADHIHIENHCFSVLPDSFYFRFQRSVEFVSIDLFMLHKGIVFFCRALCQGLKPVCVMCHPVFVGPLFHAFGHCIGDGTVQTCSVVDDIHQLLIDVNRQVFVHLRAVEHILPVEFSRAFFGRADLEGAFPESFLDCFKS